MYRIPVLVALGANLGDPESQLATAVEELGRSIEIDRISSRYRTEPVGIRSQPDFLNQVLAGSTELTVFDLHRRLQAIELALGRTEAPRNGPRMIDIDLLAYGELAITTPDLILPHPRLHQRSFVLEPLAEIAPRWVHPVLQRTTLELLGNLGATSAVEKLHR